MVGSWCFRVSTVVLQLFELLLDVDFLGKGGDRCFSLGVEEAGAGRGTLFLLSDRGMLDVNILLFFLFFVLSLSQRCGGLVSI